MKILLAIGLATVAFMASLEDARMKERPMAAEPRSLDADRPFSIETWMAYTSFKGSRRDAEGQYENYLARWAVRHAGVKN